MFVGSAIEDPRSWEPVVEDTTMTFFQSPLFVIQVVEIKFSRIQLLPNVVVFVVVEIVVRTWDLNKLY